MARDDAMQSGHTYIFRYRIHGDRYHLGPQEEDSSIADASAANAATTTSPGSATASPASSTTAQPSSVSEGDSSDEPLPPPVDGALPKGVRFLSENAVSDLAAMGDKPADAAGDEGTWSDPIFFWADGCTSDADLAGRRSACHRAIAVAGSYRIGERRRLDLETLDEQERTDVGETDANGCKCPCHG